MLVARLAVLAKASSLAGAIFAGAYGGVAAWALSERGRLTAAAQNLAPAVAGLVGALALVAAALLLERACRVPTPPDEDDRDELGGARPRLVTSASDGDGAFAPRLGRVRCDAKRLGHIMVFEDSSQARAGSRSLGMGFRESTGEYLPVRRETASFEIGVRAIPCPCPWSPPARSIATRR